MAYPSSITGLPRAVVLDNHKARRRPGQRQPSRRLVGPTASERTTKRRSVVYQHRRESPRRSARRFVGSWSTTVTPIQTRDSNRSPQPSRSESAETGIVITQMGATACVVSSCGRVFIESWTCGRGPSPASSAASAPAFGSLLYPTRKSPETAESLRAYPVGRLGAERGGVLE